MILNITTFISIVLESKYGYTQGRTHQGREKIQNGFLVPLTLLLTYDKGVRSRKILQI